MRVASVARETKETKITLTLNLDGSGKTELFTGVGFFDHMLDALSRFALLDLTLACQGDTQVDAHHTVEDVGICLGKALREALGDRTGICRAGSAYFPWTKPWPSARWTSAGGLIWLFRRSLLPPWSAHSTPSWQRNFSAPWP